MHQYLSGLLVAGALVGGLFAASTAIAGGAPTPAPKTDSTSLTSLIGGDTLGITSNTVNDIFGLRVASDTADISEDPGDVQYASAGESDAVAQLDGSFRAIARDKFVLWAASTFTWFGQDSSVDDFTGDSGAVMVGGDLGITDRFRVGMMMPLQRTQLASDVTAQSRDVDAITFAPYLLWNPTDQISTDLTAGYGFQDIEETRNSGGGSASSSGRQWFVLARGHYDVAFDDSFLRLTLGYLQAHEDQEARTFSDGVAAEKENTDIGQIHAEARFRMPFGDFEPYALVRYENELIHPGKSSTSNGVPTVDREGGRIGAGFHYRPQDAMRLTLEFSTSVLREQYHSTRVLGAARYVF